MSDLPPPPPPASKSKGKGCLVVGCGGCLGVLLLGLILSAVAFQVIKKQFQAPPFEPIVLTAAEQSVLDGKMRQLSLDGNVEQAPATLRAPLVISEREMNAWFSAKNPDMADVARIGLSPGTLTAELRVGDGKKRLSMQASLSLTQTEDNFYVRLQSVRLGKFRLPDAILKDAAQEDLTQAVFGDAESLARFRALVERIEIQEGAFLIVPR